MRDQVEFLRARDLQSAVTALANAPRKILAGGTDIFPALQDRALTGRVLDISGIAELAQIECRDGFWIIGATASWRDTIKADLPAAFDALKAAGREVGSVQIQNRATLAGNLCNASPAADGVPPLLILDADVAVSSLSGCRYLPLSNFILGNRKTALAEGEMVSAIRVPVASSRGMSGFLKLGARRYLVISIAMVAARIETDDAGRITTAAVAVGACSEVATRLPAVEAALIGHRCAEAPSLLNDSHFAMLTPIDDVRAGAAYRQSAARDAVGRLLCEMASSSPGGSA